MCNFRKSLSFFNFSGTPRTFELTQRCGKHVTLVQSTGAPHSILLLYAVRGRAASTTSSCDELGCNPTTHFEADTDSIFHLCMLEFAVPFLTRLPASSSYDLCSGVSLGDFTSVRASNWRGIPLQGALLPGCPKRGDKVSGAVAE